MKHLLSPRSNLPPSKFGVFFWTFVITVVGLTALLILPVGIQRQYDHYKAEIEDQIEPARLQASSALENAYQLHNYAVSGYFLLEQTPHAPYRSVREYYEVRLKDWQRASGAERHFQFCGAKALETWRAGTQQIKEWLDLYGRQFIETSIDQDNIQKAEALFASGIRSLRAAQHEADLLQGQVRAEARGVSHTQIMITIPLAGVCILLTGLSLWNVKRLIYWSEKEQETAARLESAARETHHRVKNNLQMIVALIDISTKMGATSISKQRANHLTRQVRTMSIIQNQFDYERGIQTLNADRLFQILCTMNLTPPGIQVEFEADSTPLTSKEATTIGLITGELLSYCGECGADKARITLKNEGRRRYLRLMDTGGGCFDNTPWTEETRARMKIVDTKIVDTLARHDLGGEVILGKEDGVAVQINFPESIQTQAQAIPPGDSA